MLENRESALALSSTSDFRSQSSLNLALPLRAIFRLAFSAFARRCSPTRNLWQGQ